MLPQEKSVILIITNPVNQSLVQKRIGCTIVFTLISVIGNFKKTSLSPMEKDLFCMIIIYL